MKIGILYICTGRYAAFFKKFYETCEKYFITDAEKHYFVFTDSPSLPYESENPNIHKIFQVSLGWPNNTLKRFEFFLRIREQLANMDYIFFFNANLVFMKPISACDFLPQNNENLLACLHPSFYYKQNADFTYDRNENSTAYIPLGTGKHYVMGALQGGRTQYFLEAAQIMANNTNKDSEKGVVALWHDESHWNRYILGRDDVKILTPSYLYLECSWLPFEPIIKLLDKRYQHGGRDYLRGKSDVPQSEFVLMIKRSLWKIEKFFKKTIHFKRTARRLSEYKKNSGT